MAVTIFVQSGGLTVKAFLSLTRKENLISSSLKRKLNLEGIKDRVYLEDELPNCIFTVESQVCLTISSGIREIVIVASVVNIERDLILGTDAMSRLGITLQMENFSIPLPRKRPFSRDWVLGVFAEVERSMRGPQRGVPTCTQCGVKGHLKLNCRLKTLVLSPDANEDENQDSNSKESPCSSSHKRHKRWMELSPPSPSTSESSEWENATSEGKSDSLTEELLLPSPANASDEDISNEDISDEDISEEDISEEDISDGEASTGETSSGLSSNYDFSDGNDPIPCSIGYPRDIHSISI